jgi:FkbM family methyltransferase
MLFNPRKEKYFSQIGEDEFLDNHVFGGMNGGTFVDIGAHDGVTFSNTYFFEKKRGWNGVCVEPIPEMFAKLKESRNAVAINACISNKKGKQKFLQVTGAGNAEMFSGILEKYDKRHLERVKKEIKERKGKSKIITVPTLLISEILAEQNITHVDYFNIDTEGGELEILKTIDFSACQIDCFTVEDLYGDKRLHQFMKKNGYVLAKKLDVDLVFVRKGFQLRERKKSWLPF